MNLIIFIGVKSLSLIGMEIIRDVFVTLKWLNRTMFQLLKTAH